MKTTESQVKQEIALLDSGPCELCNSMGAGCLNLSLHHSPLKDHWSPLQSSCSVGLGCAAVWGLLWAT
jgi:hypothetical protein